MKDYKNTSLGIETFTKVPENEEEYNNLGGPGACVKSAVKHVMASVWAPKFRTAFCEALEKATGCRRFDNETETVYKNRMIRDGHSSQEACQALGEVVAETLVFDPSPSTRGKKVPQEILDAVEGILAALADPEHRATVDSISAKLAAKLGVESFQASFGKFSPDSIAAALMAIAAKEARELAEKFC